MPTAYSYVRFSTPQQAKGDSYRRQTKDAQDFIDNHPELDLVLDDTLNLFDKGISAYKGKNAVEGKLSSFLNAIDNGVVQRGSYLLVESHDRLSRDQVGKALLRFVSILERDIKIVVLEDEKIFDFDALDENDLITSLLEMSRAHRESERKGELVKAAWDAKKAKIGEKKLTKWSPKWLNLSTDRTEYEVDPHRAEIVRQIFQWAIDGLGTSLIIQRLEQQGEEPWDLGIIKRKYRVAKQWHSGIIQRFLTDRTVLGEYRLKKPDGSGYEIIKDYYPRIIDDETFYRAQQARQSRNVSNKGGGRKGKTVSNLFAKIAVCGYSLDDNSGGHRCDAVKTEPMVYVNKGARYPIKYLQCSRIKTGNSGCDECRKMWRYDFFEKSFLLHIKDIDASMLVGSASALRQEIDNIQAQIDIEKGKLSHTQAIIQNFRKVYREKQGNVPEFVYEEGTAAETEEKEIKKRLKALQANRKVKEHEFDHSDEKVEALSKTITMMDGLEDSELLDLRLKLSSLLKQVVERIEVYSKGVIGIQSLPFYVVRYRSGEHRTVVVNPKDPMDLFTTTKAVKDKLLEMSAKSLEHIDIDALRKHFKGKKPKLVIGKVKREDQR